MIGCVEPRQAIALDRIEDVLRSAEQVLAHHSEFSGRPTTRVFATADHVVKVHERPGPDRPDARHIAEAHLARERACGIHLPSKTWFLLEGPDGTRVANVTPRIVNLQSPDARRSADRFVAQLQSMLRMYIAVAQRHVLRLDEGLSNFGVDAGGVLHYLDDDFYAWDDFEHLGHWLGVLLRKPDMLTPDSAFVLGDTLRSAILERFAEPDGCRRLASIVRSLYLAQGPQQAGAEALLNGLDTSAVMRSRRRKPAPLRFEGGEPIALIADIHSNLPALMAVDAEIRRRGIRRVLVLGDVVGYGPHPRECIAWLRDAGYAVLRGNHDHAAATGETAAGFGRTARRAIEWTRTMLDGDDVAWLSALPFQAFGEGWMAQHGAPMDPAHFNAYVYRLTVEDNLDFLAQSKLRWGLYGHTHIAGIHYRARGATGYRDAAVQSLSGDDHALICPGSVGQPRSGVFGAELAVFDAGAASIEFVRLDYDPSRTLEDLQRFGLPDTLNRAA